MTQADQDLLKFFETAHLPGDLAKISEAVRATAYYMVGSLPSNPERREGLRKLLEAKDCFVRAKLSGELQTVTVPVGTFTRMRDAEQMLRALEAAGVDNWEGYGEALEAFGDVRSS